jgi:hypothetical protein
MKNFCVILLLVFISVLYGEDLKPIDKNLFLKGTKFDIPKKLRNGTADYSDVGNWTKSLRGMDPVIQKDLNADGIPDLLTEIVHARGVTGNRSFMLFVYTGLGYKYLQDISNIGNYMTYDESGKSYLLTYSKAGGPEVHIRLYLLTKKQLTQIGKSLIVFAGDSGTKEGNILYNRLFYRIIPEDKLMKIFKKSNKIDSLNAHSSRK